MTTSIETAPSASTKVASASLARQPIVDRKGRLHGYELLFRGAPPPNHDAFNADRATAEVLVTAACDLGWQRLGGGHPLFVNVDEGLLMGDLIALAPAADTIIEVVEQVEVTDEVHERIVQLREAGFRVALDDFVPGSSAERLLGLADFVKVDVLQVPVLRVAGAGQPAARAQPGRHRREGRERADPRAGPRSRVRPVPGLPVRPPRRPAVPCPVAAALGLPAAACRAVPGRRRHD